MKLTKLTLSLFALTSILSSPLSFGQEYRAEIKSGVMDAVRNVSSLDFTKDNLKFNFQLATRAENRAFAQRGYTFTSDAQISCMEASVSAAKRALMNPAHRAFLKAMKVDHVTVSLLDVSQDLPSDTYGPSIVDDPYFIISAVKNSKGQCMFATDKQLNDQFFAWEKSYSKTGGLKEISHDLAEEITDLNKHFDDDSKVSSDNDHRVASRERHGKRVHSRESEDHDSGKKLARAD